jgi:hypothetical protein
MKMINVILFQSFYLTSLLTSLVNCQDFQWKRVFLPSIDYYPNIWTTRNANDQCHSLSIILFHFSTYNLSKLTSWPISGGISPVNWLLPKYLNKKWKWSMRFFQSFYFTSSLTIFLNWPIDKSPEESLLSIGYYPNIWTRNENDQWDSLSIILFDFFTYKSRKLSNWPISGGISPVNRLFCKDLVKIKSDQSFKSLSSIFHSLTILVIEQAEQSQKEYSLSIDYHTNI